MREKLLYEQVYAELKARIREGRIGVDARLPAPADLGTEFSVSAITVKRALDMLQAEGYVVRRPKHGTVVISADPQPAPAAAVRGATEPGAYPPLPANARAEGAPLLGALITSFDDTFGTALLASMIGATSGRANLVLKTSVGEEAAEGPLIEELLAAGIRGLAFQPSSSQSIPPLLMGLLARSFPVVIIDRSLDGVPVSTVCSDNLAGARAATEYLFELGHRRLGLITSASRVSTVEDRRNGYVRAHAGAGVPHQEADEFHELYSVTPGSRVDASEDLAKLTAFVEARPELTAYLVSEHHLAIMLRRACRDLGRRIPQDVSIVCFDQPPAALDDSPYPFTHVAQPQAELGARVVEELFAQLAEPGAVTKHVLPTRLVPGASTAPPPRS
ncbi:GntR family transcriptional regulator [Actinospica durhamensis]|uniref:GntR family transcriptional regulator n=1 Tax=Actinospica durhamensis TaxID=1508375 RepID=A0A941IQM7_9ACTN|nr:GntR family transcriptional regulator [Actinospica durhamensis]MBR7833098.1 GntR family transcriptional regulator [Actinospica durhamensis]